MAGKKLKKGIKDSAKIFKHSVSNFGSNRPVEHAGTTAYFAIFSMAPMLFIIISVFGYLAGDAVIRDKLFEELNKILGPESVRVLKNAIENYNITEKSGIGAILGIVFFLISASALFTAMQNSINYIWRIQVKTNLKMSALGLLKTRLLSFGVILCLGLVLLISLIIDASVSYLKDILTMYLDYDFMGLVQILNFAISIAVVSLVFSLIYRYLPDVKVRWSASWFAAITTSLLFALGKFIIGKAIGGTNLGAVYGTAGSLAVILVWIFFVSIIFYFGVELSRQFSLYYKHNNVPAKYAYKFEVHQVKFDAEEKDEKLD